MCATSFVFSKEHKTFSLRGIQTATGIHRLTIFNRSYNLTFIADVHSWLCVLYPDSPGVFKSSFMFRFHAFLLSLGLSLWDCCNEHKRLGGVVCSLFPVQTFGELWLVWGEVISHSNCRIHCRAGGGVKCYSFTVHSQLNAHYGYSLTN